MTKDNSKRWRQVTNEAFKDRLLAWLMKYVDKTQSWCNKTDLIVLALTFCHVFDYIHVRQAQSTLIYFYLTPHDIICIFILD